MKKIVALVALAVVLLGVALPPADAHHGGHGHGHGHGALALAAFAAFNVLFLPFTLAAALVPPVVYAPPAPVYSSPAPVYSSPAPAYSSSAPVANTRAAYAAAPAPAVSRQVVYPHGRYVLFGDGVSRAYQWIWVPNAPPPGSAPGY